MSKKEHVWADENFVSYLDQDKISQETQLKDVNKWNELTYGRQQIIDNLVNLKKTDILLDIGCGDGERLKKYDNLCFAVGIDISLTMCKKAKANLLNGEVMLANMENLPFKNNSLNKVLAIYSLIYAPHKSKTMNEISRILRDDSELIIYEPNKISLLNLLRYFQTIKYTLFKEDNPKALHHRIASTQSLGYLSFKKLGNKTHLKVIVWCGHFYFHIIFRAINQEFLTKMMFNILNNLNFRHWGRIPLINLFSDYLIIKFIKFK